MTALTLPQMDTGIKPRDDDHVERRCSKGWGDRCARSKGPRCKCACGGHNHGNPKAKPKRARLSNDQTCDAFDDFGAKAITKTQVCRWCGSMLCLPTYGYPHDGGQDVPGMGRFWLYVVCPKCEYQWSLWKLLR